MAKKNVISLFKKHAVTFNKITWGSGITLLYGLLGKTLPWASVISNV
jgi:hypothetical protein